MNKNLKLALEAAKLSAYGFVLLGLAATTLIQFSRTSDAFQAVVKK